MDEISAEDEIREAFKVFDSVSRGEGQNTFFFWDPTMTEKQDFFENVLFSEWRRVYQPARAGLCDGQFGIADGQRRN